ncbi:MAG: AMP-binding protein, partial [Bryobacterales bacterium]|nr:AMP-binding protein [Bryobacterales bacterium]
VSFFAVLRLGAVVVNVNPIYTAHELARVAADSGMRALITLDTLTGLAPRSIEMVIATTLGDFGAAPAATAFRSLIEESG